jgi:hypothetical protein
MTLTDVRFALQLGPGLQAVVKNDVSGKKIAQHKTTLVHDRLRADLKQQ